MGFFSIPLAVRNIQKKGVSHAIPALLINISMVVSYLV